MTIGSRTEKCPKCRGKCPRANGTLDPVKPSDPGYCGTCGNTGEVAAFAVERRISSDASNDVFDLGVPE